MTHYTWDTSTLGPLSAIPLANMNRSRPSLEGLPAEVVLNLASYLNSHEAGALRCTCKHLATLASGAVFASIPISLHKGVLAGFETFARRPYIGPNIQTVVVTPYLYQSPTLRRWSDGNLFGGPHKISSNRCPWRGRYDEVRLEFLWEGALDDFLGEARRAREEWAEEGGPDFSEEEKQAWNSLPARLKEAVRDAKDRRHEQLQATPERIAGMLNLMPNLQHVIFHTTPRRPYHDLASGGDPFNTDNWHGTLAQMFLCQLESSGISPTSLSVEGGEFPPFPIGIFNSLRCIRNRLEASEAVPLRNLRSLNLSALQDEERVFGFDAMFTNSGLAHLISCAPMLEVLSFNPTLSSYSSLDLDDLVKFQNPLQRLRKVSFSNFQIGCANLSQWLDQSRDTLQHIEFHNLSMKNGHWVKFLDLMRATKYTRLQFLSIKACRTVGQDSPEHDGSVIRDDALKLWNYEPKFSHELIDYVAGKTDKNPWLVRYATLFPRQWEPQQDLGDAPP